MLGLLDGQYRFWLPRLHFGAVLLVFGELIAWQNAASYSVLDWLAISLIYLALGAILLDLVVRWNINNFTSLLLVGGLFGLTQATLISLAATQANFLARALVFRPLGMEVIAFLLAFLSFRLLISGEATGLFAFLIALGIGALWGIWVRWFAVWEEVLIPYPDFAPSSMATILGLVGIGVLPLLLPKTPEMTVQDWKLTPYEAAAAGIVLLVAFVLRMEYIGDLPLTLSLSLAGMIVFMLFFTRNARRGNLLEKVTPPRPPLIIGWLILLIPFAIMGALGYLLVGEGPVPVHANALFAIMAFAGILWLPLISVMVGFGLLIQMGREGNL
jgi:hypothetical protein